MLIEAVRTKHERRSIALQLKASLIEEVAN